MVIPTPVSIADRYIITLVLFVHYSYALYEKVNSSPFFIFLIVLKQRESFFPSSKTFKFGFSELFAKKDMSIPLRALSVIFTVPSFSIQKKSSIIFKTSLSKFLSSFMVNLWYLLFFTSAKGFIPFGMSLTANTPTPSTLEGFNLQYVFFKFFNICFFFWFIFQLINIGYGRSRNSSLPVSNS